MRIGGIHSTATVLDTSRRPVHNTPYMHHTCLHENLILKWYLSTCNLYMWIRGQHMVLDQLISPAVEYDVNLCVRGTTKRWPRCRLLYKLAFTYVFYIIYKFEQCKTCQMHITHFNSLFNQRLSNLFQFCLYKICIFGSHKISPFRYFSFPLLSPFFSAPHCSSWCFSSCIFGDRRASWST